MSGVVIIGAGVAGLATAALLARDGHNVTVLERNAEVGGRSGTLERGGFRFDTGPSWYLMPEIFEHFFHLLGTSASAELQLKRLEPAYRVFREPVGGEAEVLTVPGNRAGVDALFEQLEPGAAAALDAYLASAHHTTRMALEYFLYNPFTRASSLLAPEVLRGLPELARLLLGSLSDFAAARFEHPALRQILGYPGVFLGTDPRRAPAMYHLLSGADLDEGVFYPAGGFWGFSEKLAELARREGARIDTGVEVTRILTAGGPTRADRAPRARGVRIRTEAGEQTVPADIVVSAADLHHTETELLPAPLRTYPESWWRRRTSGPGAVLVFLGVEGELPQLPHHSLFFTRDWDANFDAVFGPDTHVPDPASLYVCKPSATDATVAPAGSENLFVLVPVPADPDMPAEQVERVAEMAVQQIAEWAGIPDLAGRILVRDTRGPADFAARYHSWQGGMLGPAHLLSQSAMFRAQNASRKVRGLYYAGATATPGVGVPMCLISAELVLKRIRGDHSAGPIDPATLAGPGA